MRMRLKDYNPYRVGLVMEDSDYNMKLRKFNKIRAFSGIIIIICVTFSIVQIIEVHSHIKDSMRDTYCEQGLPRSARHMNGSWKIFCQHLNATSRPVIINHKSDKLVVKRIRKAYQLMSKRIETLQVSSHGVKYTLTAHKRSKSAVLLHDLLVICKRIHGSCFMTGKTLLGSYTMHSILPDDDDVEMAMHVKSRTQFHKMLQSSKVGSFYRLQTGSLGEDPDIVYSLFHSQLNGIKCKVKYYSKSNTGPGGFLRVGNATAIRKSVVFPLKLRPFEGFLFQAPHNTTRYLRHVFGSSFNIDRDSFLVSRYGSNDIFKYIPRVRVSQHKEALYFNGKRIYQIHVEG